MVTPKAAQMEALIDSVLDLIPEKMRKEIMDNVDAKVEGEHIR